MKKNRVGLFPLVLAVALLCSLAQPVLAAGDTVFLRTAEDLYSLAEKCQSDEYSRGLTVKLEADLDLKSEPFSSIPIFCGSFDGMGHTISGLLIDAKGSQLGLFRYVTDGATVTNLTLSGEVHPDGSKKAIGMLAGENAGIIENCFVFGFVEGGEQVGGLVGYNEGTIRSSENWAQVRGSRNTGGIAGENTGRIESCCNQGTINPHNDETFRDTGGICGRSSGTIEDCANGAEVGYPHNGYNTGGIVGIQDGAVIGCTNTGAVKGRKEVGGIVGQLQPQLTTIYGDAPFDALLDEFSALSTLLGDLSDELHDSIDAGAEDVGDLLDLAGDAGDILQNAGTDASDHLRRVVDEISLQSDRITASVDSLLDELDILSDLMDEDINHIADDLKLIRTALTDGLEKTDAAVTKGGENIGDVLDEVSWQFSRAGTQVGNAASALKRIQALTDQIAQILAGSQPLPEKLEAINNAYATAGNMDFVTPIQQAVTAVKEGFKELEDLRYEISKAYDLVTDEVGDMLDEMNAAADLLHDAATDLSGHLDDFIDRATDDMEEVNHALDDMGDILHSYVDDAGERFDETTEALDGQLDLIDNQTGAIGDGLTDTNDEIQAIMDRISNQFTVISDTAKAVESPEFSVEDASNDGGATIGLVRQCENLGAIEGDHHTGGIVGMAAYEYFDDPEEDWEPPEELLVDMTYRFQAVMTACTNRGSVKSKNDYAGGILGRGDLGAVTACVNTGDVETEDGDYCGGIAGRSSGYLVQSHAQCLLTGNDFVGGIAGEGEDMLACYAMPDIQSDGERLGAIAGHVIDDGEVSGNYYVDNRWGGIDGIHYGEKAMALPWQRFIELPGLPEEFLNIGVSFRVDGKELAYLPVEYGEAIDPALIPACPEKAGYGVTWESFDQTSIRRKLNIEAVYTLLRTTISTPEDQPLLLVEGDFAPNAAILVEPLEIEGLELPQSYLAQAGYRYEIKNGAQDEVTLRVRSEGGTVIGWLENGEIRLLDTEKDGSYLIFQGTAKGEFVILTQESHLLWVLLLIGAAVIAIGATIAVIQVKKRRKKAVPIET